VAREPYRLFRPTVAAVGLLGAVVWVAELARMQRIGDPALVLTLLAFFLLSRALAFPPGVAILGKRLPSADATFDLTMPALCALAAGGGPLALTTVVYIGYGLEIFTRQRRVERVAFNAGKIAIAGLLAALAAFGTVPRTWPPVDDPLRYAVIVVVFALSDAAISAAVAAMRENRGAFSSLIRNIVDAGLHWDAAGGLAGGYAIVFTYARLGIPATVLLCLLLSTLVWMERRTRQLRFELERTRSQLAAQSIAEPQGDFERNAHGLFSELRNRLGLDLVAVYAPAPGERALILLAGTPGAPQRIPLVPGSCGPLESALAGVAVEIEDIRSSGGSTLAPGTEHWRAVLALPLEAEGTVLAVLLATRTTPFLPGREARLHLREAGAQLAHVLASRLSAEERLQRRSREIYRDVIAAATGGKLEVVEREDLERSLAALQSVGSVTVRVPRDVRAARSATERAAAASGLGVDRIHDVVLCVSETATNVLKHAGQGEVQILSDGERLVACVRDTGPGIPFAQLPKATLMRGFSSKPSLGYGFTFLLEFLDHIRLATGTWGTIVAMEVALRPREDFDAILASLGYEESGTFPPTQTYYQQG